MVRLTADLIWKSPHLFNGIRERELDLRGNKIAVIENLGGTERLPLSILKTLEEVARLEKALKSGQLPADLKIGDDGMTNNEAAKEDKMVTDEQTEANDGPRDAELEQKKNESAEIEQD